MTDKDQEKKKPSRKRKRNQDEIVDYDGALDTCRLIIASLIPRYWRVTTNPKAGDMVVETSVKRYARAEDRRSNTSLLTRCMGRLLMVKKGCEVCALGKEHPHKNSDFASDGEDDAPDKDGPHHEIQELYVIETPLQQLQIWYNCSFVVVDNDFSPFTYQDEAKKEGDWEKFMPLHGNAQEAVEAALKRHGIESWKDAEELSTRCVLFKPL